jgi:hypothetical protein
VKQDAHVVVKVAPGSSHPGLFCWHHRIVRVLAVETIRTLGTEQRYRVRTVEGYFELAFFSDVRTWRLRRTPSLLGRVWMRWLYPPRYPLPKARRRAARMLESTSSSGRSSGGRHQPILL